MNIPKYNDIFIKEMKRRNFSQQTIDNYSCCLCKFLSQMTKEHPIHINESDIKEYLGKFSESNTQRSVHSAIKKFYDICMNQKEKFRFIPYARKSQKLPIVLSEAEMQRMFDVCDNIKHRAILGLLYGCGLRVSEVINLKITNIDSSRNIINIIQAKGKKDRQVMLPLPLLELLRKYFAQYRPKEYLFNGQSSTQYSSRSVNEFLKQLATKAKIESKRVYAHLMRHNCFTHMVERGTDINLIQRIAGHSNVKTTNIYIHISHNLISQINSPLANINI